MDHGSGFEALLDKDRISDLIHAYAWHFDRAEAEAVVALFTKDAHIDYGPDVPPMTGQAAFAPMIEKGLRELFLATSHHVSNVTIRLEGPDTATGQAYVYAWHRYREGGAESELWGQYHFAVRRTSAGWKIARLELRAAGSRDFHRLNMHPIGRRQF